MGRIEALKKAFKAKKDSSFTDLCTSFCCYAQIILNLRKEDFCKNEDLLNHAKGYYNARSCSPSYNKEHHFPRYHGCDAYWVGVIDGILSLNHQ